MDDNVFDLVFIKHAGYVTLVEGNETDIYRKLQDPEIIVNMDDLVVVDYRHSRGTIPAQEWFINMTSSLQTIQQFISDISGG